MRPDQTTVKRLFLLIGCLFRFSPIHSSEVLILTVARSGGYLARYNACSTENNKKQRGKMYDKRNAIT